MFWGRVSVESAAAFLYFEKSSSYRKLLHAFKYKGKKEIGHQLGRIFGHHLKNSRFSDVDFIIPMPLHKNKLRKRGYNQSEELAKGIAQSMGKSMLNKVLVRAVPSTTQTKKSRFERWQNVEGIFKCIDTDKIKNKHLLLVDDVVTTGATFEALVSEVNTVSGLKVSVAALAVA